MKSVTQELNTGELELHIPQFFIAIEWPKAVNLAIAESIG